MTRKRIIAGIVAIAGGFIFVIIVLALHILQPNYDPVHQHMSELAIGPYGLLMLIAFSSFATAVFSVQVGLRPLGAPLMFRILLMAAAFCLLGAGIVKLDAAPFLHVGFIAAVFVLLVVAMYLLPRTILWFHTSAARFASWGLAAVTTLSVSLGGRIPAGIAQRIAASCILLWLFWTGWHIIIANEIGDDSGSK